MRSFLLALSMALMALSCNSTDQRANLVAPTAPQKTKVFEEHGGQRTDPYFWLNDKNDSAVIRHLRAENEYFEAMTRHTDKLERSIFDEIISRMDQKYESLPVMDNGYWYYARYEEGKQYPLLCRRKGSMNSSEEVMLNIPELAEGKQIFQVNASEVSPDNNWLAYMADTSGDRRSTIHIKNLNTGQHAADQLRNTASVVWGNDNKTIYYTENDHTVRSYKVKKHVLGTDPATDQELFMEKDSTFSVFLSRSRDNRYIFITSFSTTTSESRYIDANNPAAAPVVIQPRVRDLLYLPESFEGNVFHIRTNKDARNFKLVTTPVATPGLEKWQDLIKVEDSALLENVAVLQNYIVLEYRRKGLPEIKVIDRKANSSYTVDFGEEAFMANMYLATDAYDLDSIRYVYQSMTTPRTDYGYSLSGKEKKVLKQARVAGGFKQDRYETRRLWAKATDGTMVPISIVYNKNNFKHDGSNPLLLYAYGSYGASSDPYFDGAVFSILDRGFVYAIAHIRGGQEMGRYWYEDGKLLKKKNTFTDFVDCAQFLVNEKYTSPNRLFAQGGSAGGMLMGAVTNMRPDLFRGIIAEVPWMDVITDMYNTDLPLTTLEFDEWGDPRKKEYYDYMLSWSPYDNVKKANYPSIFATAGLNDTQVLYFSPAKWVLKVRENNTGKNPVLFKVNMGAGHSGESGRFESQKLISEIYAFMIDAVGDAK